MNVIETRNTRKENYVHSKEGKEKKSFEKAEKNMWKINVDITFDYICQMEMMYDRKNNMKKKKKSNNIINTNKK